MSLILPNNYLLFRFIAIDPGIDNTGIAIYTVSSSLQIMNIETMIIHPGKMNNGANDIDIVSERMYKLLTLKKSLSDIVACIKPATVISESPFYHSSSPMAYGSLIETISYLRMGVFEIDPNISFRTVEPLVVKKNIKAGSTKGKVEMKDRLKVIEEVMNALLVPIDILDEHQVDAIAIGYYLLKTLRG